MTLSMKSTSKTTIRFSYCDIRSRNLVRCCSISSRSLPELYRPLVKLPNRKPNIYSPRCEVLEKTIKGNSGPIFWLKSMLIQKAPVADQWNLRISSKKCSDRLLHVFIVNKRFLFDKLPLRMRRQLSSLPEVVRPCPNQSSSRNFSAVGEYNRGTLTIELLALFEKGIRDIFEQLNIGHNFIL